MVGTIEAVVVIIDCISRHLPIFAAYAVVEDELLSMVGWGSWQVDESGGVLVSQQPRLVQYRTDTKTNLFVQHRVLHQIRWKMDIFKPMVPNAVYMKNLQIFLSARGWWSIQLSRSRSAMDQSYFHCLWLCKLVWKWPTFLHGASYKKVHINQFLILKEPFLHSFVIFKDPVIFLMLSAALLMHGQIFANPHRHGAMKEGGERGYFWCKKAKSCPWVLVGVR